MRTKEMSLVNKNDVIRFAIGSEEIKSGKHGCLRECVGLVVMVMKEYVEVQRLGDDHHELLSTGKRKILRIPHWRICSIICRPMVRIVK